MNKLFSLLTVRKILDSRILLASTRINAQGKDVPKEKKIENRITLISPENTTSITDLRSAQQLALRRDLKLVKIEDISTKTRRPIYRLMTSSEYHNEELQQRKEKQIAKSNKGSKGEKLLNFSTKIGEHDLMTYIRKMVKLLSKQFEVRVIINLDSSEHVNKSESMYALIEKNVKDISKVVQKRNKGNTLRFQLIPMSSGSGQSSDSSEKGNKGGGDLGPL